MVLASADEERQLDKEERGLLAEHRGVRNPKGLPSLRAISILAWADTYYRRNQRWPKHDSGPIAEAPGETWSAVNAAFYQGLRSLSKGFSLARFLERHRRVRNHLHLPRLTLPRILAWADAVYQRTGKWPTANSGGIHEAPGETWSKIHSALKGGNRGLPGGSSLARFLQQRRGVPNHLSLPPLTHRQILRWADAFHRRTGH
jgi:hypothetical protein